MFFRNSFVLASSSKSRFSILKKNGLSFVSKKPKCKEDFLKKKLIKQKTSIKKISLELARLKSKSISSAIKNKLVVGSDTTISLAGKMINKAKNKTEAKKTIKNFSGKKHLIYSSASVFYNNKEIWNHTQKSVIKIRKLNNKEINAYLKKSGKQILYSVGCYQAEQMGPNIIEEINGDFFNVMGFPLFPFLDFLKKYKQKND